MKPSAIKADSELKALLSGHVTLGDGSLVTVYNDGERPTNGVPDDFIEIYYNGSPWSVTDKLGLVRGNLAVALYCKLFSDNTVKLSRIEKILAQFESLIDRVSSTSYFYRLNLNNFITPTTANINSGYSVTVLNVSWRTK